MTDTSRAKRRGPGRPFKKGADPNRNPLGRVSQARSTWMTIALNQLALELDPKEAARLIAKWYRQGKVPLVLEAHDRLGGKVTQTLSGAVDTSGTLTIKVIETK